MAFSLTQFQNNLINQLPALDNNITTLSAAAPIPCVVAGTNALTLTQNAAGLVPSSALTSYTQNQLFTGVAAATNTGAVTATVGSIGVLNVYKDTISGPVLLSGGELILGNAFSLMYDATLNTGAGGFHIITTTAGTVGGGSSITNRVSGGATLTFTATPGWSSQDQMFTLTGLPPTLPAVGDFVQVNPPSLAAAGVGFAGYVSAVGSLSSVASVASVAVRLINSASASLASNSGVYRYLVTRTTP